MGWSCAAVVREANLPRGTTWNDVESNISRIHSMALDWSMPLWSLTLLNWGDSCQVAVWRFHHSVGDGVSFGAVTSVLLADDYPPYTLDKGPSLLVVLSVAFWLLWGWFFVLLRWTKMLLFAPPMSKFGRGAAKMTGRKLVAIGSIGSVARVKQLGHSAGGATLNDVVLTAISRAVASMQPGDAEAAHISVAVPANIRLSNANVFHLQNQFGSLSMYIPVNARGSFRDSLTKISSVSYWAKLFPEPWVGFIMLMGLQWVLPLRLYQMLFDFLASNVKMSVSNVKGPPLPVHYFGKTCSTMIGIVPPPNGCGIGIAIVSYGDDLLVSVATDEAVCTQPRKLLELIALEIESATRPIEFHANKKKRK